MSITRLVDRTRRDEAGQDLVEYALLGGLVALVAAAVLLNLGTTIGTTYTNLVGGTYALWQPPPP